MSTFDYVLKITDGTTTITLTSSPFACRFDLPSESPEEATVSGTIYIRLLDGSAANNLDELRSLNRLLRQAKTAQNNRAIAKVYVVFKESAAGSEWRSEIKSARATWDASAFERPYWTQDLQLGSIYLERANFWEGPEAQIALTNGNGTNNTAGLTIYNHDDAGAGHDNWVSIAAASVAGDLPGATRLEITNSYNNATGLGAVWIGQNWIDPANFAGMLEGEDAALGPGGSSDVVDVNSSGGYYASIPFASLGPSDPFVMTTLATWTISGAALAAVSGQFVKAVARFINGLAEGTRFQLQIYANTVVPVWEGPIVVEDPVTEFALVDLGTFRLPPWLDGLTSWAALDLKLFGAQRTGSSITLALDYMMLLPLNGYRWLNSRGEVEYNSRIVDDGIEGRTYSDDGSGGSKLGFVASQGAPIMLEPNKLQRLYFCQHSGVANTAEIVRTASVKVHYRPRRLEL